jgi:NTP pyrophosphatase (non-canonical NTP hydrolase)
MTIKELQEICFKQAEEKGWTITPVLIPEQVALICSEACEALESWRDNQPISWVDTNNKPQGVGSEYADIIIRVCHYAKLLDIDLDFEIKRKLEYNRSREYRHGGKLA